VGEKEIRKSVNNSKKQEVGEKMRREENSRKKSKFF
jgi:hypothetical protein